MFSGISIFSSLVAAQNSAATLDFACGTLSCTKPLYVVGTRTVWPCDGDDWKTMPATSCASGTYVYPTPQYAPGVTGSVTCSIEDQYVQACSTLRDFTGACTNFVCETQLTTLASPAPLSPTATETTLGYECTTADGFFYDPGLPLIGCTMGTFVYPTPDYAPGVTGVVDCSIQASYITQCSSNFGFTGECTSFVCETQFITTSTSTTSTSTTSTSTTSTTPTSETTTTSSTTTSETTTGETTTSSTTSETATSETTTESTTSSTTGSTTESNTSAVSESTSAEFTSSSAPAPIVSSKVIPSSASGPNEKSTTFITQPNVTVTVDETVFTTYCDEPTTFTWGGETYTVTRPTTLTITSCPDEGCEEEDVTTTLETTVFTTYCPEPTTFTWGGSTYTITEPTTVTICTEESESTSASIVGSTKASTESPEYTTLTGTEVTTVTIPKSSHGVNTTQPEITIPTASVSTEAPPVVNAGGRVGESAIFGALALALAFLA